MQRFSLSFCSRFGSGTVVTSVTAPCRRRGGRGCSHPVPTSWSVTCGDGLGDRHSCWSEHTRPGFGRPVRSPPFGAVSEERVGVFGGTFDPPHNGHLVVATGVRAALGLDRVLMVVAGEPWQKVATGPVTSPHDRLAMVEALVHGVEGLEVSEIEVHREGASYTADTLAELTSPGRSLHLVLGFDAAAGLPTWERVDEVRALAVPVLVDRPGVPAPPLPDGWAWQRVDVPRLDISSTDLRRRLRLGAPVEGLMPREVISCVSDRELYSEGP